MVEIQFPIHGELNLQHLSSLGWNTSEIKVGKWLSKLPLLPLKFEDRELFRIWGQVELLGGDKRLDFLIFLDDILVVIEVKGHSNIVDVPTPTSKNNPWEQCNGYKQELIEQVGGYLPVTGLVVFPNLGEDNAGAVFKKMGEERFKIGTLFEDDLKQGWKKTGDYVVQLVDNKVSSPNVLCALHHLFPDTFVTKLQGCIPEIHLYALEREQLTIAKSPTFTGDRIVYGVAGSGKTFLLVNRVKSYLAIFEELGYKVLILCYNKPLQLYLSEQFSSPAIEVRTVLGWFRSVIMRWNNRKLIDKLRQVEGTELYFERLVKLVQKGMEDGLALPPYELVLIDEGQDFDKEWLKVIRAAYSPRQYSLFAIYLDGLQTIHKRRKNRFTWSEVGISARGRTKYLRKNYRNASNIAEYAVNQVQEFVKNINKEDPEEPDFIFLPDGFGRLGGKVNELQVDRNTLSLLIATILDNKKKYETAMIIFDKVPAIDKLEGEIRLHLERLGNKLHQVFYSPSGQRVSIVPSIETTPILSVYRSKGLEADDVIFVFGKTTAVTLKYVAITRARENLFMVELNS